MTSSPFRFLQFIFIPTLIAFGLVTELRGQDSNKELGPARDVAFIARSDGSEQRYVIRLPSNYNVRKPLRLLVALHGHGSDRWQFANDLRDECRAARDVAARNQLIYVCPDYRAKTSWMGPAAEADLLQILDDLQQQFRIETIFVCGGSMGGTSAIAFAALHPECVDGVVSLNGTSNMVEYDGFAEAIAASYGGTKSEKPNEYRRRSAEFFPERLTMPVALTTGGRDSIVPPDSTLRLAKSLKERSSPVHLIHRPEGGHETSYADTTEALQYVITTNASKRSLSKPLMTFDSEPKKIVCLGDSVTGIYYHTGGLRAYPEMLELSLKQVFPKAAITVINAGISGQTTADGLARLEQDVLSKQPNLVTISFGLNDMTRIPLDTYRANLEMLVQRCREQKSQVVLCTPNAVIDTPSRPVEKLVSYCEVIRAIGRDLSVPVCDQYHAGNRFHNHAPWAWRLTLSDEIHPNMDGHKRMAEQLFQTITGEATSLQSVGPPRPSLRHVRSLLQQGKPVRVLAMPPYDAVIGTALKQLNEGATAEVTSWAVEQKSISALELDAKDTVRSKRPDLVILAVPRSAAAEGDEQFVRSYSWIMNWSLSFGIQEWDCLVVHPSVAAPETIGTRDELIRQLTRAQDLDLIDRAVNDKSSAAELFSAWFRKPAAE